MVTKLLMKSLQTRNELLNIAIKASIQAGNIIMKIYNNEIEVGYKEDQSPITLADQQANISIVNDLVKTVTVPNE
jgi:3'(2'), 5'-bisphosphate nucleotidase